MEYTGILKFNSQEYLHILFGILNYLAVFLAELKLNFFQKFLLILSLYFSYLLY